METRLGALSKAHSLPQCQLSYEAGSCSARMLQIYWRMERSWSHHDCTRVWVLLMSCAVQRRQVHEAPLAVTRTYATAALNPFALQECPHRSRDAETSRAQAEPCNAGILPNRTPAKGCKVALSGLPNTRSCVPDWPTNRKESCGMRSIRTLFQYVSSSEQAYMHPRLQPGAPACDQVTRSPAA